MKASAVLVACLILAAPAQAFVHLPGPHGHAGRVEAGRERHHGHGGFGGYGLGIWGGVAVPEFPAREDARPASAPSGFPPPDVIAATLAAASALAAAQPPGPGRPTAAPSRPSRGPHIIYVGARPTIHGPRVIYGTD